MIGLLVPGRVRIKIRIRVRVRVGVTFNVRVYRRSKCRTFLSGERQGKYKPIMEV